MSDCMQQEVGHAPTPYHMYLTETVQALLFTDYTRRQVQAALRRRLFGSLLTAGAIGGPTAESLNLCPC